MRSLIVGGGHGLGAVVATALRGRGDDVLVLGRSESPTFDLEREETWGAALPRAPWDNLIFCQRYRGEPDWRRELAVAALGPRKLVDYLASSASPDGAAVVIVGSPAAAKIAGEQSVEYHMAKAALAQWVRFAAVEMGRRGIRVNLVTPARLDRGGIDPGLVEATPLRRISTNEDVADVISFLCGPGSRCVTGQEIFVDGGLSLLAPANLVNFNLESTT